MKMAKPSKRDIDAAGDLMSLLHQLDRGDYPNIEEDADVPDWFDEDDPEHLRAFYDAVKATLDKGPGYPGRVIGGMCYVIMYGKNEIIDPESDVIELHPKLVKALELAEASTVSAPEEVRNQALEEAAQIAEAEYAEFLPKAGDNNGLESDFAFGSVNSAERIAAAIRALRTTSGKGEAA